MIKDGEDGFKVNAFSINKFVSTLTDIISSDQLEIITQKARAKVEKDFCKKKTSRNGPILFYLISL